MESFVVVCQSYQVFSRQIVSWWKSFYFNIISDNSVITQHLLIFRLLIMHRPFICHLRVVKTFTFITHESRIFTICTYIRSVEMTNTFHQLRNESDDAFRILWDDDNNNNNDNHGRWQFKYGKYFVFDNILLVTLIISVLSTFGFN